MYHTPHKKKKYFRRELSVIIFLYKSKAFLCCFFKKSFIYLCIIFGCAESPLLCGLFPFVASGGRSVVAVASLVEGGLRGMPHQHVFSCGGRALRHAASARAARGLSCSAIRGIFPDQGSNPCLLHWQVDSPPLSYQGSPCACFEKIHTHVCILTHTHTHTQLYIKEPG